MRLGQLARKISIHQSDVVDFLAKSGIVVSNESNAKLDDDHVKVVLQHFAPSFLNEKMEDTEPALPEVVIPELVQPAVIEEELTPLENVITKAETPLAKEEPEEVVEVIKAPKVDLPGLKVLGKIDLPEPKKKEAIIPTERENVEQSVSNPEVNPKLRVQRTRNNQDNRRERSNRPTVNPIALQREREARAAEEKRKADAIKEKEKRTEYYLNRVKTNVPTKAARIYTEPVEVYKSAQKREGPKTWLGKFFRWLRSE
jgi:hypothetical protein